jgi:hypothetical protein
MWRRLALGMESLQRPLLVLEFAPVRSDSVHSFLAAAATSPPKSPFQKSE